MPGAGHLVHMPAHIYMRVGRYADAVDSNVRAAAADEDYIAQCQAQGLYPVGYYPHNIHFLWSAAAMDGRAEMAIDGGRKVGQPVRIQQIVERWEQEPTRAQRVVQTANRQQPRRDRRDTELMRQPGDRRIVARQ